MNNSFIENFAEYYGNDWASPPFQMVLSKIPFDDLNFTFDSVLTTHNQDNIETIEIKSLVAFNLSYFIWIIDQFNQPAFIN